jgi:hypothetical protein
MLVISPDTIMNMENISMPVMYMNRRPMMSATRPDTSRVQASRWSAAARENGGQSQAPCFRRCTWHSQSLP